MAKGNPARSTDRAWGWVNTATDQLGTFTYGYYGATARLQTVSNNQNGLNMSYSYQTGATQDYRLADITNFKTGTTVLSKFDYSCVRQVPMQPQ